MVIFLLIPLWNCPFITQFTNNTVHSYGPQTNDLKYIYWKLQWNIDIFLK